MVAKGMCATNLASLAEALCTVWLFGFIQTALKGRAQSAEALQRLQRDIEFQWE